MSMDGTLTCNFFMYLSYLLLCTLYIKNTGQDSKKAEVTAPKL